MQVTIDLTDDEAAEMRRWRMKCDRAHESPFADVRVSAKVADALPEPPRPIVPGDRVFHAVNDLRAVVIAVDDGAAWVRFADGGRRIVLVHDLRHADPTPLEQPEAGA